MKNAWEKALKELEADLPPALYQPFIESARLLQQKNQKRHNTFTVEISNQAVASQLAAENRSRIQRRIQSTLGKDVNLRFEWPTNTTKPIQNSQSLHEKPEWLNPGYTFDRFCGARSNRFAVMAAESIVSQPGRSNPVYIYGESGLGKTHLVHSMAHALKESRPDIQIGYITFEDFRDDLSRAIQQKKTLEFKDRIRSNHVLILEHLQNLRGASPAIKEEIFHLFNSFYDNSRQLILTSEFPASDLLLSSNLLSRFLSGLHVQIQTPDFHLRKDVLEHRLAELDLQIADELKQELSTRITGSLREVESAVNRLYFLKQRNIDFSKYDQSSQSILEYFNDLFPVADNKQLSIDKIVDVLCQRYHVSREQILGSSRKAEFTLPRHIGMYIGIHYTTLNKSAVARYFRKSDHTTVLNAEKNIQRRLEKEVGFRQTLEEIVNEVRKSSV